MKIPEDVRRELQCLLRQAREQGLEISPKQITESDEVSNQLPKLRSWFETRFGPLEEGASGEPEKAWAEFRGIVLNFAIAEVALSRLRENLRELSVTKGTEPQFAEALRKAEGLAEVMTCALQERWALVKAWFDSC